jgi:antirestriction protein ArdC
MRQANELGGHVRKGEESTAVVFWKIDDVKQGAEGLDNKETGGKRTVGSYFASTEFGISNNASFRKAC